MSYLILIRHGESEWNAKGLWTGLTDVGLTEKGREDARKGAKEITHIHIDLAFTSKLKRARQTLDEILKVLGINIPVIESAALNERDYGVYTGKNKWEIQKQIGDEAFLKLRRSWNHPVTGGESLKDVYRRVIPFYQKNILPELQKGKNVIVSGHGNSLRTLIKYLDNISDEDISKLELPFGKPLIYPIL